MFNSVADEIERSVDDIRSSADDFEISATYLGSTTGNRKLLQTFYSMLTANGPDAFVINIINGLAFRLVRLGINGYAYSIAVVMD
jgi:hypothetical protein